MVRSLPFSPLKAFAKVDGIEDIVTCDGADDSKVFL